MSPIMMQRVREVCEQWNRRTQRPKDSKMTAKMSALFDEVKRMDEEAALNAAAAKVPEPAPAPVPPPVVPAVVPAPATIEPELVAKEPTPEATSPLEDSL